MKLNVIIVAAAAAILAASCGILGGTSTTPNPNASGAAAGAALKGLYGQYQADGKVDLKNLNNIINLATLLNNIDGIKNDNTAFVGGLITGSSNLVNNNNQTGVVNGLTSLAGIDLSTVTNAAAQIAAQTAASAAAAAAQAQQEAQQQAQTAAATTAATTANAAIADAVNSINTTTTEVATAINTLGSIFSLFK